MQKRRLPARADHIRQIIADLATRAGVAAGAPQAGRSRGFLTT
jgi:hypothetical protein